VLDRFLNAMEKVEEIRMSYENAANTSVELR